MQFEHASDQAQYRRPAHRAGVELYHASILSHRFEPHTHEAFGLGAITAGVGRFRWRGAEHLAPRATLMLMNPEDIHTGQAETADAWGYRMAYLDRELLAELSGEPDWWFDAAVAHDAACAAEVAGLIAGLWQAGDGLAFDSRLLLLVDALRRHACVGRRARPEAAPRFAPVLDFMRSSLDQTLSLEQLAGVAGLSPFHFLRSFKTQHHATPQQVLMALRLIEAKRLLGLGQPGAEVAAAVGLADQAHLTRAFAGRYGLTPGRYQQQLGVARLVRPPGGGDAR
ncbi:AraC family transcriptional regulator [Paucibacter sp. XJ19-41]|uniref:AraC family transcriptional regulator n=1 Tax=Paucibacter sp. XJ19-41 TaxID=2927824 RepID=UPI00234AEC0A|nr:AraC family transcriptional regulator [Paucibacter sp. XJ19-41]MDC6167818.1 AraC family transcriptional regulator [Paucibacter sp. XJ19-41]